MHKDTGNQGLIFSIDRFVGEDGPGIRTTIFMKGCTLKCIWCHSPQSIPRTPQLTFHKIRCIACSACVEVCPQSAQIASKDERRVIWEKCDHCGKCAEVCPSGALEMSGRWMTVEQVMDIVVKDLEFYRNSGGGVSFCGGEPTAQPDFLVNCLKSCKSLSIHTVVDTSGAVKWTFFEKILPYTDLFLYDIKHIDSEKHRKLTGSDNKLILDNLKKLEILKKPIWIRIPLIPGCNDSEEDLRQIAEYVKPLKAVEQVTLLPYNVAAGAKYESIGKQYQLKPFDSYPLERLAAFTSIFSSQGLTTVVSR
ncbi:MAG: glycyl-radical enzyme activating protein [SAR324 cluster bacterium]|nr:glycyl-radical enzyme activating protein [SAR324 cluster bacterium]